MNTVNVVLIYGKLGFIILNVKRMSKRAQQVSLVDKRIIQGKEGWIYFD
jgi:hypothetical protein